MGLCNILRGFVADPRLATAAAHDTRYFLKSTELAPHLGSSQGARMDITDFAIASPAFPMEAQAGRRRFSQQLSG
jgi:hypothetical protein